MATIEARQVSLAIPAAYLEDARAAAVAEVFEDSDSLKGLRYVDLIEPRSTEILRRSLGLLDNLLALRGETTVEGTADGTSSPLAHMLETMIRQLAGRLERLGNYGPLPLGDMLDVIEELRWAAEEAIRITPGPAARLTDEEKAR
jgi:hypothetical protein